MAKGLYISKVLAIATVVLTVSSIGGIIAMMIAYETMRIEVMPTPPPTPIITTPYPTGPPPNMRLPGNLIPKSYDILLQPHLYTVMTNATNQSLIFTGNSTVCFKCLKNTTTIILHSKEQNVNAVGVTDVDNIKSIKITETLLYGNESNFLEIRLDGLLVEGGNYCLVTEFQGELLDDLAGFYLSSYKKGYIAASQMQPTDARKVFPCFDEPAMKATFKVTIIHRPGTTALANGKERETKYVDIDGETWQVTSFQETKIMSTYLLAIAVDIEIILNLTFVFSIWFIKTYARPEAIKAGHANFAASITGKILDFYESPKCFDMSFPLSKLDQIALPDFSAGAMENWGLVTYRETALLYEDGVSSTANKEWIATVIAHELAHQWFGNMVTMKWWNDLWLNEGFATYISYMGVDNIKPEWHMKDLIVLNDIQPAFQVDSLASSHPLSSKEDDIQTSNDITELFDVITYSKGAAVLRMLEDLLSERLFLTGLRNYLQAFMYNNTVQNDLWDYLQKVKSDFYFRPAVDANGDEYIIAELMDTWTNQMGYPVITINTTTGAVFQRHFLLNQTSDYNFEWHVPIRVMKEGKHPHPKLQSENDKWVLANVDCKGYFRVNYDPANWDRLLSQLERNIHQLLYHELTTKYLRNDTEYIPWESALRNLDYFILMFDRSEVYGPIQAYLRKQVRGLYQHFENVTMNSTAIDQLSHSEQYNHINSILVACSNEIQDCQKMVTTFFDDWMTNKTGNNIHPNLKAIIYCQAIAAGGEKEWEFAWGQFQNATTATEKDKLRYALSCTKKIWLLNRYLEYTLDPDKIRKMDAVSTINYIARNVAGQAIAWNFVRANWKSISLDYGGGIMSLGGLIEGVTQRFSTDFELHELREFQSNYNEELGSASRALEQAIERTQANIKWVKENKQTVLEWFRRETSESS
uniref:Aminopeptidase n=1 Tax=Esox lucius TaxID=8010 RepID=A0A6Q2Y6I6_ESOLU